MIQGRALRAGVAVTADGMPSQLQPAQLTQPSAAFFPCLILAALFSLRHLLFRARGRQQAGMGAEPLCLVLTAVWDPKAPPCPPPAAPTPATAPSPAADGPAPRRPRPATVLVDSRNLGLANLQPGDLTDAPYQQMAAGAGPSVSFVRALLEAGPGLLINFVYDGFPTRQREIPRQFLLRNGVVVTYTSQQSADDRIVSLIAPENRPPADPLVLKATVRDALSALDGLEDSGPRWVAARLRCLPQDELSGNAAGEAADDGQPAAALRLLGLRDKKLVAFGLTSEPGTWRPLLEALAALEASVGQQLVQCTVTVAQVLVLTSDAKLSGRSLRRGALVCDGRTFHRWAWETQAAALPPSTL
eukprot:EG_transcript_11929